MKNFKSKALSVILIICAILLFLGDFSKKSISSMDKKRIICESYLIWKKININSFLDDFFSLKKDILMYFQDQKKLIEENEMLNFQIRNLKENLLINQILLEKNNQSIYSNFELHPINIKYNEKKFYGITENENNFIEQNDLIVNYCGVIGKISHVGNKMAIIMLNNHPKFSLPITFESNRKNIGLYSFSKNEILEIKEKNSLFDGDIIITSEYRDKIPEGIFVGKILIKNGKQIIENKFCQNMSFGFVLKYKLKN
jgi:cell shape-determining protein MreC